MPTLVKRALSAIFAVGFIGLITWFDGSRGMFVLGFAICIAAIVEFSKLHFSKPDIPQSFSHWFKLLSVIQLALVSYYGSLWLFSLAVLFPIYLAGGLWIFNRRTDNKKLYDMLVYGGFGLVYVSVLPGLGLRLLLTDGKMWFALLLTVVFAGDTFAYLVGSQLKGPKLMPGVSPNKTISGSLGGILGSIVGGAVVQITLLPSIPMWFIGITCFLAALVAQSGDLVESLMKRVAKVKDSGHFMPGHGGVLDRIDGALMAAPVVYAAWYLYHFRLISGL